MIRIPGPTVSVQVATLSGLTAPHFFSSVTGEGCGYSLAGSRFSYTNKSEEEILVGASAEIYNLDEGTRLGPADRNLLLGGTVPAIGEYDAENPLQKVKVVQTIYGALTPEPLMEVSSGVTRTALYTLQLTEPDFSCVQ